jgi:hypothetical protein
MACFIPTAFPVAEQVRLYVSKILLKKLKQNYGFFLFQSHMSPLFFQEKKVDI